MNIPRMTATLIVAICLCLAIAAIAPHQLPVTLYKLSLISAAGVGGYWLDRELFPYARPDRYPADESFLTAVAMLRRAVIVSAAMIAVGLGA